MQHADDTSDKRPADGSDAELWRRSRMIDAAVDEAAEFLDLAAFADGRLEDEDERERVAALLAADPNRAGDLAASRTIEPEAAPEPAIARAAALVAAPVASPVARPGPHGVVVPLIPRARPRPALYPVMRWGSLAAAILVASWLGFALGSDTSLAFSQGTRPADESYLGEWLDPSTGILRNLTDGIES